MLVGVGLVGVAAYLLWKSSQPKATANASGKSALRGKGGKIGKGGGKIGKGIRGGDIFMPNGAYGGGGLSPSAYGGEGIPTCPNCTKSGKCVERTPQSDGTSLGVVVNCVNSNSGGGYNNFVGKKRKKPRGGAYSTYGGGIGSYGK